MGGRKESSILLSIFKRRGAEGQYTKIINEHNIHNYNHILTFLLPGEEGLIMTYLDELNWTLLTNLRVEVNKNGKRSEIENISIDKVLPALEDEYKEGVMDKGFFSRLKIKDSHGKNYIIALESGLPYQGIFQVLHHIAAKNGG
jgi:hypothetical protein